MCQRPLVSLERNIANMTVADYKKVTHREGHILDGALSQWERALCCALWRVEIVVKGSRTVAVLFTDGMKRALDELNNKRSEANVMDSNIYLSCIALPVRRGPFLLDQEGSMWASPHTCT